VICHLAASIDVRASVADPVQDALRNVVGTVAVLQAAHEAGVGKVVFASSGGSIYGAATAPPIAESAVLAPESPYAASKAAAELWLQTFQRLYGMRWTALAMANVYGPRQDPVGEAGVISLFAARMLAGLPTTIYGDGSQTRDFVFVADVVRAFLAAGRSTAEGALNVSTGRETSLRELAAHLGLRTMAAPGRAGEIQRSVLDPAATRAALGWRAQVGLTEGLELTLAAASAVSSRPRP
jgi:UDP-glucose 4-epimerase